VSASDEASILRGALLWLRNHYDLGSNVDLKMKDRVVEKIDALIDHCQVSRSDIKAFREYHESERIEPQ
jgi:hypothetical protein